MVSYGAIGGGSGAGRSSPYGAFGNESPGHSNLFVGSLPMGATTEALRTLFSQYGNITACKVVTDPTTGQSKGIGFVKYSTPEEAQLAIGALDGQQGLVVKWADNDLGRSKNGMTPQHAVLSVRYAGLEQIPSDNLYMLGLPAVTTQTALAQMFASLGLTVKRSKVIPDTKGTGITAAMVQLASMQEAFQAIEYLNGQLAHQLIDERLCTDSAVGEAGMLDVKFAGTGEPNDNLYINGLPITVDQNMLTAMFTSVGFTVIRSRIVPDTKGKGCLAAMVQLISVEEAARAQQMFCGQTVMGPPIDPNNPPKHLMPQQSPASIVAGPVIGPHITAPVIVPALLQQQHGPPTLRVKYAGPDEVPSDNLYITGLNPNIDVDSLKRIFASQGYTVTRARVIVDSVGVGSRGNAAMVQLISAEEARLAIENFNGQLVGPPEETAPVPVVVPVTISRPQGTITVKPNPAAITIKPPAAVISPPAPGTIKAGRVTISLKGKGSVSPAMPKLPPHVPKRPVDPNRGTLEIQYAGDDGLPSDNLQISGLPSSIDVSAFMSLFHNSGLTVRRSKLMGEGMGLIQLGSIEEAAVAIEEFNGKTILLPGAGDTSSASAQGVLCVKFHGPDSMPCDQIFVTGLPEALTPETLEYMFTSEGFTVQWSKLMKASKGTPGASAMVQLGSLEEAAKAISLFHGQHMALDAEAQPPPPQVIPAPVGNHSLKELTKAAPKYVGRPRAVIPPVIAPAASVNSVWLTVKYAGDGTPSDSLYISGLPGGTPQATLNRIFLEAGFNVQRSKIIPDMWGTGECNGMVQLGSPGEATAAIQYLETCPVALEAPAAAAAAAPVATPAVIAPRNPINLAKSVGGPPRVSPQPAPRVVQVPAQPQLQPQAQAPSPAAGVATLHVKFAGDGTPSDNLYITGLPGNIDQESLKLTFSILGFSVKLMEVFPDALGAKGIGRGAAMVQLASLEDAYAAMMKLNGQTVAAPADPMADDFGAGPGSPRPGPASAMGGPTPGLGGPTPGLGGPTLGMGGATPGLGGPTAGLGGVGRGGCISSEVLESINNPNLNQTPTPGVLSLKYAGTGEPSDNLYVSGLPGNDIDEGSVEALFRSIGLQVVRAKVLPTLEFGCSRALAQLSSVEEAAFAIENLNGQNVVLG